MNHVTITLPVTQIDIPLTQAVGAALTHYWPIIFQEQIKAKEQEIARLNLRIEKMQELLDEATESLEAATSENGFLKQKVQKLDQVLDDAMEYMGSHPPKPYESRQNLC